MDPISEFLAVNTETVFFHGAVVGTADCCYVATGALEEIEVYCADCAGPEEEDFGGRGGVGCGHF